MDWKVGDEVMWIGSNGSILLHGEIVKIKSIYTGTQGTQIELEGKKFEWSAESFRKLSSFQETNKDNHIFRNIKKFIKL